MRVPDFTCATVWCNLWLMINRVIVTGRMVRDPELRTTTTGKSVVSFSIAVNKRFKPQDQNEPDAFFFRVSAWDKTAEYVNNYLTKGRLVGVEGRLESRKYTDKEGQPREIVEIVADNVMALDRPRDDAGNAPAAGGGGSSQAAPRNSAAAIPDEYDPFADE